MKFVRAYKTELDPNVAQQRKFVEHAHAARAVYNWGLGRKIEEYKKTGRSPSIADLHKELVVLKHLPKEDGGKPWLNDVSKSTAQEALRTLDSAYKAFFSRCKKGAARKGFPRFKSKHKRALKFRLVGTDTKTSSLRVEGRAQKMPLGEHTYRCATCGITIDRDLNAARNLRALAAGYAVDACGGDVSPSRMYVLEAAPLKQEFKAARSCASGK